jgi:transcriptional regulator with XRE-family HTH domain
VTAHSTQSIDPTLDSSMLMGGQSRLRVADPDDRRVPLVPDMGFPRHSASSSGPVLRHRRGDAAQQAVDLHALGRRLRDIREGVGWSRAMVEALSGGRFSGTALGTYERGERTITAANLCALAAFYGLPAAEILGQPPVAPPAVTASESIVVDAVTLGRCRRWELAKTFVEGVQRSRATRHRRLVTLRARDLPRLAAVHQLSIEAFLDGLYKDGVLVPQHSVRVRQVVASGK